MRVGGPFRLAVGGAALGLVVVSALAASNSVPGTNAGLSTSAISVDSKKPKPDCNGITVTVLDTVGNGGPGNDLLLGTPGPDGPLRGFGGNDCIVGGAGDDRLRGDGGIDVCIGGPGNDTFHASCETQIQ